MPQTVGEWARRPLPSDGLVVRSTLRSGEVIVRRRASRARVMWECAMLAIGMRRSVYVDGFVDG